MAEKDFDLFADNGVNPVLPTIPMPNAANNNKEAVENEKKPAEMSLKTEGLKEAISGEFVKTLLIPENMTIDSPNYVLDFRHAKTLRKHQIEVLATLLSDCGDVYIYVCVPNGLDKIGMGESTILDEMLQPGIESVFGESCRIYKDVAPGEPLREVKKLDPGSLRLNL